MPTKLFFKGATLADRASYASDDYGVTLTFENLKHEVLELQGTPRVVDTDTGAVRELSEHEVSIFETAMDTISNHFLAATLAKLVERR